VHSTSTALSRGCGILISVFLLQDFDEYEDDAKEGGGMTTLLRQSTAPELSLSSARIDGTAGDTSAMDAGGNSRPHSVPNAPNGTTTSPESSRSPGETAMKIGTPLLPAAFPPIPGSVWASNKLLRSVSGGAEHSVVAYDFSNVTTVGNSASTLHPPQSSPSSLDQHRGISHGAIGSSRLPYPGFLTVSTTADAVIGTVSAPSALAEASGAQSSGLPNAIHSSYGRSSGSELSVAIGVPMTSLQQPLLDDSKETAAALASGTATATSQQQEPPATGGRWNFQSFISQLQAAASPKTSTVVPLPVVVDTKPMQFPWQDSAVVGASLAAPFPPLSASGSGRSRFAFAAAEDDQGNESSSASAFGSGDPYASSNGSSIFPSMQSSFDSSSMLAPHKTTVTLSVHSSSVSASDAFFASSSTEFNGTAVAGTPSSAARERSRLSMWSSSAVDNSPPMNAFPGSSSNGFGMPSDLFAVLSSGPSGASSLPPMPVVSSSQPFHDPAIVSFDRAALPSPPPGLFSAGTQSPSANLFPGNAQDASVFLKQILGAGGAASSSGAPPVVLSAFTAPTMSSPSVGDTETVKRPPPGFGTPPVRTASMSPPPGFGPVPARGPAQGIQSLQPQSTSASPLPAQGTMTPPPLSNSPEPNAVAQGGKGSSGRRNKNQQQTKGTSSPVPLKNGGSGSSNAKGAHTTSTRSGDKHAPASVPSSGSSASSSVQAATSGGPADSIAVNPAIGSVNGTAPGSSAASGARPTGGNSHLLQMPYPSGDVSKYYSASFHEFLSSSTHSYQVQELEREVENARVKASALSAQLMQAQQNLGL